MYAEGARAQWYEPLNPCNNTDHISATNDVYKAIVTKFIVSGHRPHSKRPARSFFINRVQRSLRMRASVSCQLPYVARDVSLG